MAPGPRGDLGAATEGLPASSTCGCRSQQRCRSGGGSYRDGGTIRGYAIFAHVRHTAGPSCCVVVSADWPITVAWRGGERPVMNHCAVSTDLVWSNHCPTGAVFAGYRREFVWMRGKRQRAYELATDAVLP
jgi:hypothetical protein